MPNMFLTPSVIGREALMILENQLVATQLFHRGHTEEFTGAKVGDTITVRGPGQLHRPGVHPPASRSRTPPSRVCP